MSHKHLIKSYLTTQTLNADIQEIEIAMVALNTIKGLDEQHLAKTLKIALPINNKQSDFGSGCLNIEKITPSLQEPLSEQQHIFLQICALLDSANEQSANDYLCLYLANKVILTDKKQTLEFFAGLCKNFEDKESLAYFLQPNEKTKEVTQTGWVKIIQDKVLWDENDSTDDEFSTGSEMILPIYTPDDNLLGILYAYNKEKNKFSLEKQTPLIALSLVFSELLLSISWQNE